MRTAIYNKLKEITSFSDRVYQAYVAESNTTKPYCAYKFTQDLNAVGHRSGYWRGLEVYIYVDVGSFTSLDTLVKSVIEKLNGITLTYQSTKKFVCELDHVSADFGDENGFFKIVTFRIPSAKK